jgi:hypothetical protein
MGRLLVGRGQAVNTYGRRSFLSYCAEPDAAADTGPEMVFHQARAAIGPVLLSLGRSVERGHNGGIR